jgi:hypothetical protein
VKGAVLLAAPLLVTPILTAVLIVAMLYLNATTTAQTAIIYYHQIDNLGVKLETLFQTIALSLLAIRNCLIAYSGCL